MVKRKTLYGLAALVVWSASTTYAGWTGDSLSGVLNFGGLGTINFFDPAKGLVPGGSSGIQPNAVVADPDGTFFEFMLRDGFSGLNVDVDATTLLVHQFPTGSDGSTNSWEIYVTGFDPDLTGAVLSANTIPGLTWSLMAGGDGLHVSYPGGDAFGLTSWPNGWQALFTLAAGPAIPAPGAIAWRSRRWSGRLAPPTQDAVTPAPRGSIVDTSQGCGVVPQPFFYVLTRRWSVLASEGGALYASDALRGHLLFASCSNLVFLRGFAKKRNTRS